MKMGDLITMTSGVLGFSAQKTNLANDIKSENEPYVCVIIDKATKETKHVIPLKEMVSLSKMDEISIARARKGLTRDVVTEALAFMSNNLTFDAESSGYLNKELKIEQGVLPNFSLVFVSESTGVNFVVKKDQILNPDFAQTVLATRLSQEQHAAALEFIIALETDLTRTHEKMRAIGAVGIISTAWEDTTPVAVMTRAGLPVNVDPAYLIRMNDWTHEQFLGSEFTKIEVGKAMDNLTNRRPPLAPSFEPN